MTLVDQTSPRLLSGWGRTSPVTALVGRPVDADSIDLAFRTHKGGIIPRGLGRSYGDAAQCSGGLTVEASGFSHIGKLNVSSGTIEVGGGVSLHDLMRHIIPSGWFVAVTPGTRYVSVGGAIAADVHGKNHHRDGSFANHVVEMTLVTPTGTFTVSPATDPELFWATAGGMGLTGVVISATLRLIPIETSWMQVDSQRFTRLDDLMSTMEGSDDRYRYSVAWLDCLGHRDGNHRSVLTRGDHAPSAAIPGRLRARSREVPGEPRIRVPWPAPNRFVNRMSVRALNEAWFRASSTSVGSLHPLAGFFHPLDGVGSWNLLYGPGGFVQYQFAVPPSRGDIVTESVACDRVLGDTFVPGRVEAIRPGHSRATLLQPGRLDPGTRLPARSARVAGAPRRPRRARRTCRWTGLLGQGRTPASGAAPRHVSEVAGLRRCPPSS